MTSAAPDTSTSVGVAVPDLPRRRVCVLSEDLSGAPDEGTKKLALSMARAIGQRHDLTVLSTEGRAPLKGARLAPAPRTFLSGQLRRELVRSAPELLIYISRASTTFMTFIRARLLRAYCPGTRLVVVGLQARRHGAIGRRLIRHLAPDLIFVQSPSSQRYLEALGCEVALLPSGVDTDLFRPVTPERRRELRERLGLPTDRPVVLHVGHLKRERGVGVLADLSASGGCQPVLIASSSTAQQADLAEELRRAGVDVRTDYQPNVEHFYQVADCYVFPVESSDHAIEVPLSVLEAFASDLPVVTTPFGGLPRAFGSVDHPGLVFVDTAARLVDEALRLCRSSVRGTRALALPYSWEAAAASLLTHPRLAARGDRTERSVA